MNTSRLAIFGAVLCVAGMILALVRPTEPTLAQRVNDHIAAPECKTVQQVIDNNSGIIFHDFAWRIEGSSSLGTNPHLLLEHQSSILLRNQLTISEYDFAMAQLTDSGPVYFFFKDGCIVQTVLLRGGQEA